MNSLVCLLCYNFVTVDFCLRFSCLKMSLLRVSLFVCFTDKR